MKNYTQHIPKEVAVKLKTLGEAGEIWFCNINSQIQTIKDLWGLKLGEVLHGGSDSLVIEAITQVGQLAVLKISIPDSFGLRKEVVMLNLVAGNGYPKLYQQDAKATIFLMERLGQSLATTSLPLEQKLAISCQVLKKSWLKIDNTLQLTTGLEKADWLVHFIQKLYQEFPNAIPQKAIFKALQFLAARKDAYHPTNCVLVHGDAHFENILASLNNPTYKLIDPEGLFAEPAYDLAIPMRENNAGILGENILKAGRKRSELLAKLTGVEELAIWQWGFIERISTGLYLKKLGYQKESQVTLQIATIWSARKK
ncbi:MAG: aminoglycoside phosphotransferase family protein [Saprospiraceae bacterium]